MSNNNVRGEMRAYTNVYCLSVQSISSRAISGRTVHTFVLKRHKFSAKDEDRYSTTLDPLLLLGNRHRADNGGNDSDLRCMNKLKSVQGGFYVDIAKERDLLGIGIEVLEV